MNFFIHGIFSYEIFQLEYLPIYGIQQCKNIQQLTMHIYTNTARGGSMLSNTTLIGTRQ